MLVTKEIIRFYAHTRSHSAHFLHSQIKTSRMESVMERFEKARKANAIIVDFGTPFQRMRPPEPARIAASITGVKLPVPVKAPVKRARQFEVRKVPRGRCRR